MSVRKKWMIMFAIIVVILGLSIGFQSYHSSRTMVVDNKKNEMADTINRIDININFWVVEVSKFAERTVEGQLTEEVFADPSQAEKKLQTWFSDYAQIIEAISDAAVLDSQGTTIYHYKKASGEVLNQSRLEECCQKAFSDMDGEYWLDMGNSLYSEDTVLTMVKAIPGAEEESPYGILVIELNPDIFKSLLLNNQSLSAYQYTLIVDKAGNIVCASEKLQPEWLGEVENIFYKGNRTFELNWEDDSYYVCGQYNGVTGWKTYSIVSIEDIFPQLSDLRKHIAVIVIITVLIALSFVAVLSYTFTKPVHKLVKGMNEVQQENFEVEITEKRKDEFGQLFDAFNYMVRKIRQLIYEVYQEKIAQKNAEIQALQAQINPHFLYNTLDSINWMLIEQGEMEISDVVISLGDILRYSIGGKEGMVSLEDEIRYTKSYLCIQKNRLEERLDYQLEIAEDTLKCKVPKLLLQPIVENAVLHGIEPKKDGGMVVVISYMEEDRLMVSVKDNGAGMAPEVLEKIRDRVESSEDEEGHIGMKNIRRRLELCYGPDSFMRIESIPQKGTTVTLGMPQKNRKEGAEDGHCDY